jgi:hypothetical protein
MFYVVSPLVCLLINSSPITVSHMTLIWSKYTPLTPLVNLFHWWVVISSSVPATVILAHFCAPGTCYNVATPILFFLRSLTHTCHVTGCRTTILNPKPWSTDDLPMSRFASILDLLLTHFLTHAMIYLCFGSLTHYVTHSDSFWLVLTRLASLAQPSCTLPLPRLASLA